MATLAQINDTYRLISDGKHNFILQEKYEKRIGRGKNAELSGEFDYRDKGYFSNIDHLGDYLIQHDLMSELEFEETGFKELIETVKEVEKNITALMKGKVFLVPPLKGEADAEGEDSEE